MKYLLIILLAVTTMGFAKKPKLSPTPVPTSTPVYTVTPTPTPVPTVTPTLTPVPTATPTPLPTATPTPVPTSTPSVKLNVIWTSDYGYTVANSAQGSTIRATYFLNLKKFGINHIVLESKSLLSTNKAQLKNFVEDCHSRGISVEFMVNASNSVSILSSAASLANYAGYAATYQTNYCITGSEAACVSYFSVDFEPHVFPAWSTNMAQAQLDYLSGLSTINTALRGKLKLAAAVTNWYDKSAYLVNGINFVNRIISAGVKRLEIMNYTHLYYTLDTISNSMISRAMGEVSIACSTGVEVFSIADAKNEEASLTFYGLGFSQMNIAWNNMNTYFSFQKCFIGNAGFDYNDMIDPLFYNK